MDKELYPKMVQTCLENKLLKKVLQSEVRGTNVRETSLSVQEERGTMCKERIERCNVAHMEELCMDEVFLGHFCHGFPL